jgi:rod shape-determining protein MreC
MRNLLNFLARYNNLILFLLLEGIALILIITENNYHNARLSKGVRGLTRGIDQRITNTKNYLNLRDINSALSIENADLQTKLANILLKDTTRFIQHEDSLVSQKYLYTSALVVNNSVNKQKNFFTLNKGKRKGVDVDMAVITSDGVAGIIVASSDNYSIAMSLLNIDFRLSSRFRGSGYFGSLAWDGRDTQHAVLSEIPQHVPVAVGDTVETTGYSAIFPEGIMIGTVSDFKKSGGDFYVINIKLANDFRKLSYVRVIGNLRRTEQKSLETQVQ